MVEFNVGDLVTCEGDPPDVWYEITDAWVERNPNGSPFQSVDILCFRDGKVPVPMKNFNAAIFKLKEEKRQKRTRNLPDWF